MSPNHTPNPILRIQSYSPLQFAVSVFFLGLIIKLVFFFFVLKDNYLILEYNPDASEYYRIAINLIEHGEFSRSPALPLTPDNLRTPMYPFFVALIFLLFEKSLAAVVIIQIILASLIPVLIFLIARQLDLDNVGRMAAVLFAVDISSLVYAQSLQTETLFAFLFTFSLLLLAIYLNRKKTILLMATGIVLGLASLCRPIALYFGVPVAFIFLSRFKLSRQYLHTLTIFFLVFIVTISPWIIRNYFTFGVANFTSAQGVNLLLVNAAYLEGDRLGITPQEAEAKLETYAQSQMTTDMNEAQKAQVLQRVGVATLLHHPIRYLKVHITGVAISLIDDNIRDLFFFAGEDRQLSGSRDRLFREGIIPTFRSFGHWQHGNIFLFIILSAVYHLVIYFFGIVGLIILFRRRLIYCALLLLLPVLYLVGLALPAGDANFRYPAMPFIFLLSSMGIIAGWELLKDIKTGTK